MLVRPRPAAPSLSAAYISSGCWFISLVAAVDALASAALLAGLGAPWNTLQAEGQLQLNTRSVQLHWAQGRMQMQGQLELNLQNMSSRLSPVKPMGSYRIELSGTPEGTATPSLQLSTLQGPLMLTGQGQWVGARSGQRFETMKPMTGKQWAFIPRANPDNVDHATHREAQNLQLRTFGARGPGGGDHPLELASAAGHEQARNSTGCGLYAGEKALRTRVCIAA